MFGKAPASVIARKNRDRAMELAVTAWSGTEIEVRSQEFAKVLRHTAGQILDWIENGPEEFH